MLRGAPLEQSTSNQCRRFSINESDPLCLGDALSSAGGTRTHEKLTSRWPHGDLDREDF